MRASSSKFAPYTPQGIHLFQVNFQLLRRHPCVHQLNAHLVARSLGQVVASTSKKL